MPTRSEQTERSGDSPSRLKKELGLWNVYCIASGAMFSSGFFLLPGLAAARAGPSAVVAYLLAGLFMVPSMLSMLELCTALPRAGGAYYFVDRSLGPAVGTVTGIGSWLGLVFKSAFALVGMGAYLAVAPGLEAYLAGLSAEAIWFIKAVAVGLAGLFVAINIVGAKESAWLQSTLVVVILAVLAFFIGQGLWHVFYRIPADRWQGQFQPFLHAERGWSGLAGTIGLVFISYAGVTKVASVSEEVRRPEQTLPLGVILALATATAIYVVGVFIMIAVLDPAGLHKDLTPVATAAVTFTDWLPGQLGLILIILAAVAAFASTGNAGILSASRYPLAMARDNLMPASLKRLGRFHTPTTAILLTGAVMALFILLLSTEQVAKLGSAFNLLVFTLINLAVIVMRESRIESYDPGFRVPLYPWTPLAGAALSTWLIITMGWLTTLVALGVVVAAGVWYLKWARPKVRRYGAIHHVFARLGQYRHAELRTEFREIIKEKGLREDDPYDEILRRAEVLDIPPDQSLDDVIQQAGEVLAKRIDLPAGQIVDRLIETGRYGGAPISHGAALLHFRAAEARRSELVLARAAEGVCVSLPTDDPAQSAQPSCDVFGLFVLVSPEDKAGQHLRILAELAERAEDEAFIDAWRRIESPLRLKETLLRDARFLELFLQPNSPTEPLLRRRVCDLDLPAGAFVAMIRREGESFEPPGNTALAEGDLLTIIGEPDAIDTLYQRFVEGNQD